MPPLKHAQWTMVFRGGNLKLREKSASQVMHSQCRCTAQLTVSRWSSFSLGEAGGRPTPLSSMPLSAICVPWDSTSACLHTHTHTYSMIRRAKTTTGLEQTTSQSQNQHLDHFAILSPFRHSQKTKCSIYQYIITRRFSCV